MQVGRRITLAALGVLCGLVATATTALAETPAATPPADEVRLLVGMAPGHDVALTGLARAAAASDARRGGLDRTGVLTVARSRATAALDAVRRQPGVAWAELDHQARAAETTPNDPQWSQQWGHSRIRTPLAWDTTVGAATVTIAILDTGVRADHPDLVGGVLPGWDYVNNDADTTDDNGHGTSVAGVAAARGNNGTDVAGVCWSCSILPVKVLDHDGLGFISDIGDGIRYAADHGAHVINLSLSSDIHSSYLDAAVAYAREQGAVVVAAAGNAGTTTVNYPAGSPGAFGVAGSMSTDARYAWSNYGSWVRLAAPGCQRTLTLSGTGDVCGTSLASPAVAGVAALLVAANPGASLGQIESSLADTAVPVPLGYVSSGRVDAGSAVASAASAPAPEPVTSAPDAPTGVSAVAGDAGATVSWTAPASDGGSAITGYTITASPGGAATTAAADARSVTVSGLTNGTAYTFTVQATNAVGTSAASEPSAPVTPQRAPAAPTTVRATAGAASAWVRWDAPTDDGGAAITGYTVRATPGGATVAVDGDARSARVEGLDNGTSYTFVVDATNAAGTSEASSASAPVTPTIGTVGRVAGDSRVTTAVAVSKRAFTSAEVVVIARADAYADALAAAPLAARHGAPVLLSPSASLPTAVRSEVSRLGAHTAILVGGTAALSPTVEEGLRAGGVTTIQRIAGQNRYDTARLIAREVGGETVVVVEGANADARRGWPDAVAASAYAASSGQPILLVTRDGLPAETAAALREIGATRATVVGGPSAVSDAVVAALDVPATRIAGADRYATSVAVAEAALGDDAVAERVWVATGRDWPDALAAGPAVAARGGLLLLVDGTDLARSAAVEDWLEANDTRLEEAVVVGGAGSVSDAVHQALSDLLV